MATKKTTKSKVQKHAHKHPKHVSIPIIHIKQGGHDMFAFVASSDLLRKICTVSRREDDTEKGYQRHLRDSRLKSLAKYIDTKKGAIPNNIIVDFYDPEVKVDYTKNTITFPTDRHCAWVIDGQHRLFGFEFSETQYPLLVLGFERLKQKEQVQLFVTINTQQRKLPTSLCLDLLNIIGDETDIDTRCRELVAALNEDEDSPWYEQIDMTGEGVGRVSLVNFIRKLKPLITGSGVLRTNTFEEQLKAISNYWTAVKAVYADQWGASLLTKTLGFGALMNLFTTIFTKTLQLKGEFTVAAVIETFRFIKDIKFDADTLGSGTGNKAEITASAILEEELDEAIAASLPAKSSGILKL